MAEQVINQLSGGSSNLTSPLQYTIRGIPPKQTHEWLLKKHYAHRIPSITWAFGIYNFDNLLQGICTIGKPASSSLCDGICGKEYSHMVYELNRLCLNDNHEPNLASYFVSRVLTYIRIPLILVSYADTAYHHTGYIYQATNWIYTGLTKERTDIATPEGSHARHYDKAESYPDRQLRSAKYRYVYFIHCDKKIRQSLNYKIFPYPKGDNKRYDASYTPQVQGVLI